MKKDIVGATFMAVASSSSELFINCVATFITEGDIGVGTIVGSAVFNILAVPACCGLIAGQVIMLNRWSLTRDCLMYGFSVVGLILCLLDGKIMWYESLCLVLAYALYIAGELRAGSFCELSWRFRLMSVVLFSYHFSHLLQ